MNLLKSWALLTATTLVLGTAGCTQHYNGALTFGAPKGGEGNYEEFQQAYRTQLQRESASGRRGDTMARFETDPRRRQTPDRPVSRPVAVPAASPVAGIQDANYQLISDRAEPAARAVGSSRLFGEIGSRGGAGFASSGSGLDNLVRVTFTEEGGDFDPSIDAAGEFLVFASTRHSERPDLYYTKFGANSVTRLTDDPSSDEMPDVSPDGEFVVYTSDRSGSWDIYMMEVGGRTAVRLTDDDAIDMHPSFSPDGRSVVFCSFNEQAQEWQLVVVNVDSPGTKTFLGPGLFPSWSPVDNRIVYQRERERGDRRFGVWVLTYVNGQATLPTELAASTNAAAITPDWSPDGNYIVFCTVVEPGTAEMDEAGPKDIWVMLSDGGGRSRLTGGRYENLLPTWGSDGYVYFVSDRAGLGTQNIWAARPDQALRLAPAQEARLGEAGLGVPLPGTQ
ncbi:MAG: DPP IV N-terminal domain-containing protein [Phycisphaeraceae bacterium]